MRLPRLIFLMALPFAVHAQPATSSPPTALPLVELFTSEGCSSCPPADRLLAALDREGAAIVLSEHVDYWNRLGWSDPFSAPEFSRRQEAYATRFKLDSSYTPQAVVNGERELVGNQERDLRATLRRVTPFSASVQVLEPSQSGSTVKGRVRVGALAEKAEVWVAVAQREAVMKVERGENRGAALRHVSVVRRLMRVASVPAGSAWDGPVSLPTDATWGRVRLVAWVQQPGQGRVLGAAQEDLP